MTDTAIAFVHGRRVWDSRGRPTVEAEVLLEGGGVGRAIAPAGASTGTGEALELRDGGDGVRRLRRDPRGGQRERRDRPRGHRAGRDAIRRRSTRKLIELDGTPNKSRLGANAVLAVSMAAAHAAAAAAGEPLYRYLGGPDAFMLPLPQIQIFGGGAHAGRRVDIQDFMVMCPAAESFAQALDWTAEVYRAAGALMRGGGHVAGRRRRGRLVAGVRHQRAGAGDAGAGDRARRASRRAARWRSRSTSPRRSSAAAADTSWRWTTRSWTATA